MNIIEIIKEGVIEASTSFRSDQFNAYHRALENEDNKNASYFLELLIENAKVASDQKAPLCDDTGIPHVLIEVGEEISLPPNFFENITKGIARGLKELPARPMAVKGNDIERLEQTKGLYHDPSMLVSPSFLVDKIEEDKIKVYLLMLGGGPEIRSRTYRVFHQRDYRKVFEEVVTWLKLEVPMLGCTPCIPAVGIGRTHFEATSLMIKAMVHGNLDKQNEFEEIITNALNSQKIGTMGLGGNTTALGSFVNIGPQRASGVRIVAMRPCCCVEPRRASISLNIDKLSV
ncbi:MAG: fumarate hydratase [Methanobacteriaceae archaeon]|nr:fumarate hydratase [Methanobacteriaceae archaeon]